MSKHPNTQESFFKKGTNKIETQGKSALDLVKGEALFNEKLTMFANMYVKDGTKSFVEKKVAAKQFNNSHKFIENHQNPF